MNYKMLSIVFGVLMLSSISSMIFLTNPSIIINGTYSREQLMTGYIIAMSVFLVGLICGLLSFSSYVTTMEGQQ